MRASKDQIELFKSHFNRGLSYRLHHAISYTVDVLSCDEILACCKAIGISSVTAQVVYDEVMQEKREE